MIRPAAPPATPWAARRAGGDYGTPATPGWREVDWSPHVHQVEVDGRTINYCDYGESRDGARPIMLVHGLGAAWQCWLETMPRLAAEGRRVVALDLPGHGSSDMPRAPISIEGYGRSVESLCDRLDLGQVVAVGHSMGGFTAAEFAIQYPQRVERLVLQAAAGISTNNLQRAPLLAGARVAAALGTAAAAQSDLVARRPRLRWLAMQTVMRHPSRIRPDFIWELVAHAGAKGFLPALEAIVTYDFRDRLSRISCPTLVIWGREDMLVPARDADEYARTIPNARKVVFEDTGHSPMMERPQTFNDVLAEFLAEERAERPSEEELEESKRAGGEQPLYGPGRNGGEADGAAPEAGGAPARAPRASS